MENRTTTPSADELLAHAAFVRGLALSLVGNVHDADEVAQETYLQALQRPPTVLTNVRAWLAGVTRNVIRMRWRAQARRVRREEVAARPDAAPSTADTVARMEVLRQLTGAVEAMAEPYRTTLLLRYYDRLMPAEIARRQSVPVKTVKTRLHRGLGMLRERLDAHHPDRRSWALLLVPLVTPGPLGLAPVASGAILVTLKLKLALVLALLLAVAAAVLTVMSGEPDPAPVPERAPSAHAGNPADESDATADAPSVQEPPPAETAPPGAECVVRVVVVDAESGAPIGGVAVHRRGIAEGEPEEVAIEDVIFDPENTTRVFADDQGKVVLRSKSGYHVLVVRHPRYEDWTGDRFALVKGDTKDLEIRLTPYAVEEREIEFPGVVTDGVTTAPLSAVAVICRYREGREIRTMTTLTSGDGRYVLTIPANADLQVTFEKAGYDPARIDLNPTQHTWRTGDVALLGKGAGPKRGDGRLVGVVSDLRTGKPLPWVPLTLLRGFDESGGGGIGSWGGFKSGGDGTYRIDLKPADDIDEYVRIVVNRPGYRAYRSELVPLAPDRITEFPIALVPETARTCFTGTVTDAATGEPIAGASLHTKNVFDHVIAQTTSDERGTFDLVVRGEEDDLVVRAKGYASHTASVRGKIQVGSGETFEIQVALARTDGRISGTVRAADGTALAGVTLSLFHAPEWCGPGPLAVSDDRGGYVFEVAAGRYLVRAVREGYGGGCGRPVDIAAGGREVADITLHATDCVVTGVVRNAATGEAFPGGAEDVMVLRLARDAREELECRMASYSGPVEVETNGARFTVNLPPGKWLVMTDPRGYFKVRCEIVLRPGERLEMDLELEPVPPPTAMLRGVVLAAGTRAPVAGARVVLRMRDHPVGRATCDDQGRFEANCPPGEITIRVTYRVGHEPVSVTKVVTAGASAGTDVEILVRK